MAPTLATTPRRPADPAIELPASLFRQLLDAAPDAMVIVDAHGVILFVNAQIEALFGWPPDELIGQPIEVLVPDRLRTAHAAHRAGYDAAPRARHMGAGLLLDGRRRDGGEFPVEVALSPLAYRDQRLVIAAVRDVTGRQRAERSFRELLEAAPDAMVMVDSSGRIVLVNSQTERLFGWSRTDLLGKPVEALIPHRYHAQHERHRAGYAAAPRVRSMGTDLELHGLRSDGSEFPIEVSLSPVTTESGVLSMAAIRDITDRKRIDEVRRQAERELARRADALARSNAELEQFAYVASHDLQEPLRTVASYTQLLRRRQDDDPRVGEYIDFINGGVRQMQALIEDLLAYSRVSGEPPAPVDLNDVMKTVLKNLAGAMAASGGEVVCEPLPTVPGHAGQLVQLLQNLIGNALKYHGAEPPRVRVGCQREAGGWQFRVSDNGIGIDPAHFEKIFVIFQRLHSRERYSGTGIGLALCRKIVNLHGGHLWVESAGLGKGSTFRFTLPERAPEG